MQFADDAALSEALASRVRDLRGLLEFDWDRDGQFAHPYSDLSALVVSATDDRQLTGDLPDEVSTLTGYASSELTVTLEGSRHADEYLAHQLFSRYFAPSPLAQLPVTGTPVRYSRIVGTDEGERVIRQFTGWVRSAPVDYDKGIVTIEALDNLNISGQLVTLPRFAVTDSDDDDAVKRPFSATWVLEETLRQAGRPTIPVPREDAVVYVTCNGSFIPSYGYGTFADGKTNLLYNHYISYTNTQAWQDGKYGLAPVRNTGGTGLLTRNGSSFNAQYQLNPAPVSASGQPCTVSAAAWVYANGSSGAHNNKNNPYFHTHFHLESTQFVDQGFGAYTYDAGCTLEVFQDGSVRAQTLEAANAAGGARRWIFDRTTALPGGWHYIAAEFAFQWNDVTSRLWIDDTTVPYTGSQESTGGYRYTVPMAESRENWVNLIANIPSQHVQWWRVYSLSGQYRPGQGEPSLTADEHPLARVDRTLSEMTWIPDITNTSAWTVLQNVANAEFGVVTIDEWGTVQTLSHGTARQVTSQSMTDAVTITDDHLFGMLLNTDEDHYRNTISLSHTDRTSVRGIVYTPDDVYQFSHIFSTWNPSYWTFPTTDLSRTDIISIYGTPDRMGPDSDAAENIIRGSVRCFSGIVTPFWFYDASFQPLGEPYYALYVGAYPDQRSIAVQTGHAAALVPVRDVFATDDSLSGSSIKLAGTKYGENAIKRLLIQDTDEVARQGVRMVELSDNNWRQSEGTVRAIANSLLADTLVPVPTISGVKLPCDPRRQIRDVVIIQSETGKMGRVYAQIIGITRSDGESDSTDELTLRVVDTPGGWRLGDPDLSILGSTTVL